MLEKRRAILYGYYGNGNLGDEAILLSTKEIFKGLRDVDLDVVGHSFRIMNTFIGERIDRIPFSAKILYKVHYQNITKKIRKSDALILGGGGIIYDREARDLRSDLRPLLYMQSTRKPTMIYAVGVASIWRESSRYLIKQAAENAEYVSCRDPFSAMRMENLGITSHIYVTGDPAIRVPELLGIRPSAKEVNTNNLKVYVSLRQNFASTELIVALTKLLKHLVRHYNARIILVPLRSTWFDDDKNALQCIYRQLIKYAGNVLLVSKKPSVKDFIKGLASGSFLVGMKLHSIILASCVGIPCIALSYKQDVTDFMRYIDLPSFAISLKEACDFQHLLEKTNELFDSYTTVSKKLLIKTKEIRERTLLDERAIIDVCQTITDKN